MIGIAFDYLPRGIGCLVIAAFAVTVVIENYKRISIWWYNRERRL